MSMQKISQADFFRQLTKVASAKVGAPYFPGNVEVSDNLIKSMIGGNVLPTFRKVIHTQSNALQFEGGSWFFYSKPKNCDSRKAFRHEIDGKIYLSLVDHRPAYNNQFGTPISEQTQMLVYQLKS